MTIRHRLTFSLLILMAITGCLTAQDLALVKTISIPYGAVWCIPAYDGSRLVVSAESSSGINVAAFDLDLNQLSDPTLVASSSDTAGNDRIADHKHIFQNGYHYLTFSTAGSFSGGYLYLLKLDRNFSRIAIAAVVSNDPPTNDMLMVGDGANICVGKYLPGIGHRMYTYDADLHLLSTTSIGGGSNRHSNGATAAFFNNAYYVVAPDTLAPGQNSNYSRLIFDTSWQCISNKTAILTDPNMLSIVSGLSREPVSGSFIMNYSRTTNDQGGPIYMALYDAAWNLTTNGPVIAGAWQRPHSVIVSNRLYLGYDGQSQSNRVSLFSISNTTIPEAVSPCFFTLDFDGDRLADPALIQSNRDWHVWLSGSHYARSGPFTFPELTGATPAPADFDGDRLADPAAYTNGNWMICFSGSGYQAGGPYALGSATHARPAPADFDGDKRADPALFGAAGWHIWLSSSGYARVGPYAYGSATNASPVPADYDGDGRDDPGMYHSGYWQVWMSGAGYAAVGPVFLQATSADLPAAGDIDGDGLADPAAYVTNSVYLWLSSDGYQRSGPCSLP